MNTNEIKQLFEHKTLFESAYRLLSISEKLKQEKQDAGEDSSSWDKWIEAAKRNLKFIEELYQKYCDGKVTFNSNGYCYSLRGPYRVKDELSKEDYAKYEFARNIDLFFSKYGIECCEKFNEKYKFVENMDRQCHLSSKRLAIFFTDELDEFVIGTADCQYTCVNDKMKLTLIANMDKCEFQLSNLDYESTIDIPSGEIVFVNDIRAAINPKELEGYDEKYSPNFHAGRVNTAKEFEKHNAIYFQIGNCACDIGKINDDKLVVGANYYEAGEDEDEAKFEDFRTFKAEEVGSICTGLWAYCATDKMQFLKACEEKGVKPEDFEPVYVKVNAGRYKFKHQYANHEERNSNIYTFVERVK